MNPCWHPHCKKGAKVHCFSILSLILTYGITTDDTCQYTCIPVILTFWHHLGHCNSIYTDDMQLQKAENRRSILLFEFWILDFNFWFQFFTEWQLIIWALSSFRLFSIFDGIKSLYVWLRNSVQNAPLTGGSSVDPVRAAYCLNTSFGRGPNMTKMSITPLSENQCVSIWAISVFPFTRSAILEKKFCRITNTSYK